MERPATEFTIASTAAPRTAYATRPVITMVTNLSNILACLFSMVGCLGRIFQYIMDKVHNRLSGWTTFSLSTAGRMTLAKAVLTAIPNFCMQIVMIPASVITEIEKLIKRFVWGGSDSQLKVSLVDWNTICEPTCSGGLGVRVSRFIIMP